MEYLKIPARFALPGRVLRCEPYGGGHVNRTFLVVTDAGRFILQRINARANQDIPSLMANIAAVTAHLRQKDPDPRHSLRLIPTREGDTFLRSESGACWRCTAFVEGGRAPHFPPETAEFREVGALWGRFMELLSDFDARTLRQTAPRFHDTPYRYARFHEALRADPLGRAAELRPECEELLSLEEAAGALQALAGELPLRLTHNDTKIDNLLLSADTGRALCVLDLDTVMPGLAAYDFGDAIRSGAVRADRRRLDAELLSAFAEGYLGAFGALTALERETLALGAWTMTLECGLRYLTDYILNAGYFVSPDPDHSLQRARESLCLAADMRRRRGEMEKAIETA